MDLLHKSKMLNAKPVSSPMSPSKPLSLFDGEAFDDPSLYRSIVGSLQYLSLTRLDVSFAVNKVCQFLHRPTIHHWAAVKRILRYLKHTLYHGLLLCRNSAPQLHAYSDADWAGCLDDRRSTGGYCIFLGRNLISWNSRKPTPLPSFSGFNPYSRNLGFSSPLHLRYGATTLGPLTLQPIPCFMLARNILR
jgi:hypothetical protein